MATIQLKDADKATVKAQYNKGTAPVKKALEALYGAEVFAPTVTDTIKTFEDACKVLKLNVKTVLAGQTATDIIAYIKLTIIARALNDGWVPDWADDNQPKYVPWFEYNSKTKRFSSDGCRSWYQLSFVGSRLCFRTRELAEYAAKQFVNEYNDFLLLNKTK